MARVEIVTYDKQWPSDFRDIAASLQALLGPEAIAIDHIGSTAVHGLSAKPLVDIDVTLPSREHVFAAITTMERAGYENRGNRYEEDVYAFMMRSTNPQRRVYLLPQGNETHQKRLLFRDYLIGHPQVAAEYSALKQKLAHQYAYDGDAYTRAKADFVNDVVVKARSTK
ncbi:GrpB family protein [Rhizobium leguminosarum]|uniref:GrpB family protein n=1 Tax=Rhizobium leguminosarum TaxID=384 RepID=UPI003F9AF33B